MSTPAASTCVQPRAVDGAAARGLQRPTVLDGLRELAAVVGPAPALQVWSQAATATAAHGVDLDLDEHLETVQWLAAHAVDLPVRAVARSLAARLRAYRVLARTGAPS